MKKIEIYEPSYLCPSCSKQIDFFENTIREMKRDSLRRPQILEEGGLGDDLHQVVFEGGRMARILCPCKATRKSKEPATGKRKAARKSVTP